ncbi:hypothetical protein [Nonomuraea sp. NPDC049709]|uniref:hypothetical protein n=1 Tax=Nonomuraea sp. NPDC049709 TaxID=3154736 RepID=UPI00342E6AA2
MPAQQPWIVPIPGTRRMSRLRENLGATTVDLSADERADLAALAARVVWQAIGTARRT